MLARIYTENTIDGSPRAKWISFSDGIIKAVYAEGSEGPRVPGATIDELAGAPQRCVSVAAWEALAVGQQLDQIMHAIERLHS